MVIKESENIIHYEWGPHGEIDYDYEVTLDDYLDYFHEISSKLPDEEKIRIINEYSKYDPDFDLDDQLFDVFDSYLDDEGFDEYKDYFEAAAHDEYDDQDDYHDSYGYNGVSPRDFF